MLINQTSPIVLWAASSILSLFCGLGGWIPLSVFFEFLCPSFFLWKLISLWGWWLSPSQSFWQWWKDRLLDGWKWKFWMVMCGWLCGRCLLAGVFGSGERIGVNLCVLYKEINVVWKSLGFKWIQFWTSATMSKTLKCGKGFKTKATRSQTRSIKSRIKAQVSPLDEPTQHHHSLEQVRTWWIVYIMALVY